MDVPREHGDEEPDPRKTYVPQMPLLPVELVRPCIEMAADDKGTALALARVCKSVNFWIIPFLYHTVILTAVQQYPLFLRTLRTTTAAVRASVRRLAFIRRDWESGKHLQCLRGIIRFCTRLQALALEDSGLERVTSLGHRDARTSGWPEVTTLLIFNRNAWVSTPSMDHHLMQNVTHLHHYRLDVDQILLLPRLTHFGYYDDNFWDDPENLFNQIYDLLSSRTLVMVVVQARIVSEGGFDLDPRPELADILDKRLFVGFQSPQGSITDRFEALFLSDDSWWDDAAVRYKNWRDVAVAEPQ